MSRRPRAPLSLRLLGARAELEPAARARRGGDDAPAGSRARDGRARARRPRSRARCTRSCRTSPPTPALALAPPVDVVPASLVGETFALRRVELRFPPPRTERCALSARRSRAPSRCSSAPSSVAAQPAAALVRRDLRRCRSSRSSARSCASASRRSTGPRAPAHADDLALVGVYDRVPIGAIAGASATPSGLELRLRAGTRARRGLLVVGRRRASGALVTAEVAVAGRLPNRCTLSICQPRTLKFRRARADAEHKEAPGNAGVPRT